MLFPPSKEKTPPADARSARRAVWRAAKLARGSWALILLAFASSVALAGLWLVPPILVGVIIDTAIPRGDARLLAILALSIGGVALLIALADALESYCQLLLGYRIERAVRVKMFESVQNQSHRFFVHNDGGAISSRLWSDVSGVSAAARTALSEILSSSVMLAATVGFMLAWNWRLALAVLCVLPPVFAASFWMGKLNQKAVGTIFRKHEEALSLMFERLNVNGFTLLNGLGYDKRRDLRKFDEINKDIAAASTRQGMAVSAAAILLSVFSLFGAALIYGLGGMSVIAGDLTIGELVAFAALSANLARPVSTLARINVDVAGSVALFERIFEWLDMKPEVSDAPDARDIGDARGHISFENVSFEYETGTPVLKGLSFDVRPGETVALVGPSGAGKTSAAYLAMRFYDPTGGVVRMDGFDLREITLSSLRRRISLVPQESVVFSASARENLLIAKPDASDAEMEAACRAARIHDVLARLPEGCDTQVGEFGHRLSGGERQRLSIARAILKRPAAIIMDEPTSALDSITERAIREALDDHLRNAATIIIAHRLSTVLSADRIIVLDKGELVDAGRHDELMARCGLYARLYEEWFAEGEGRGG